MSTTLLLGSTIFRWFRPSAPHPFSVQGFLARSWLFIVGDTCAVIYTQIGLITLSWLALTSELAVFRPAWELLSWFYLVPTTLFYILLPMLHEARKRLRAFVVYTVAATLGVIGYGVGSAVLVWTQSSWIIERVFGAEFVEAAPIVQSLWFVPLLKSISLVMAAVLLAADRVALRTICQLIVTVVAIAGAALLIPSGGRIGATQVLVVVEILVCVLYSSAALSTLVNRLWRAEKPHTEPQGASN